MPFHCVDLGQGEARWNAEPALSIAYTSCFPGPIPRIILLRGCPFPTGAYSSRITAASRSPTVVVRMPSATIGRPDSRQSSVAR